MSGPDDEPLLDIARGDQARSEVLRRSLRVLRDTSKDAEFRSMVDDVLAGRKGLREATRTPAFDQAVTAKAEAGVRWLLGLSEEERARLAEQGKEELDEIRAELAEHRDSTSNFEDEDHEFDLGDPLRRRTSSAWSDHRERYTPTDDDDEDYEFDLSDPLRRR